jgi:hypothetical protein
MPDQTQSAAKRKPEGWNIRPFDKDLRIACQTQATKEDMYDYEWVQKTLRSALGIPPGSRLSDSTHKSVEMEVGSDPQEMLNADPQNGSDGAR